MAWITTICMHCRKTLGHSMDASRHRRQVIEGVCDECLTVNLETVDETVLVGTIWAPWQDVGGES